MSQKRSNNMNKNLKGHLAALLAVCIWSTSGVSYTVVRNYLSPLEIILLGIGLSFTLLNFLHLPRMHQKKKINELYERIEEEGIDFVYSSFFTTCERFLDLPRKQELMALVNRMRKINMVKGGASH